MCTILFSDLDVNEVLDKLTDYELNYPEIEGYPKEVKYNAWLTNKDYIEKYPTITFWCYRYNKYFDQFPNFNGN